MSVEQRLEQELPEVVPSQGAYVPFVRTGNLVFTSGSGCYGDGQWVYQGTVPEEVSLEDARDAARTTSTNVLATVKNAVGDLDKVSRVVKVMGFVSSGPGFRGQPEVVNGASELFVEVFGERGKHTRSAVGVSRLSLGMPVEIEMVVDVQD